MRLLIIEDEEQLLDALKRGLMKCGYAVDTAEDGITGSEMAYQNEYDVIILDLNLPGKDGIEVLKDIRTRSMTTKVLILSAWILELTTIWENPLISWSSKQESEI